MDVDVAEPKAMTGTKRADDGLDLFHQSGEVQSDTLRPANGLYTYPAGTSAARAFDICADYTGPAPSSNAAAVSIGLSVGGAFCFVTSDRHLAYASIRSVEPGNQSVVLAVRVWDRKVG